MEISQLIKKVNEFYEDDFKKGVGELVIHGLDRDYLVEAQQKLDRTIIGSYQIRCFIQAEISCRQIKKYGLRVQFDKL